MSADFQLKANVTHVVTCTTKFVYEFCFTQLLIGEVCI